MPTSVIYLQNKIAWFGSFTGYEQVPAFIAATGMRTKTISAQSGLTARLIGKLNSWRLGHGQTNQANSFARLQLELAIKRDSQALGHILYAEEHLRYLSGFTDKSRLLVSLHQPVSQWTNTESRKCLKGIREAVVLYRKDIPFFQENGVSRMHFVHYGVNVDFFYPSAATPKVAKLLYCGVHLRNEAMLARVIKRLSVLYPELTFDLLIPAHRRSSEALRSLVGLSNVKWHAGLNDEQLRNLYQESQLLVLPMNDSGANTAIVEAMACGLPIVTTDVGGIRDYGGGHIYPLVENNDDDAMIALVERYLEEPDWRFEIARACRAFAETQLSWPVVAQKHIEIYRRIFL